LRPRLKDKVKKEVFLLKIWGGILFLSLILIVICPAGALEEEPTVQKTGPARLSLLIGTLYQQEEPRIAYRGGLSYLVDGGIAGIDIGISSGEEKRRYSARLSLEGKVPEPRVEGEISIYFDWWWRQIEEEERRENSVYSLFVGEKLGFPHRTYLYGELGIVHPAREALFLWGWSFKAGWEMAHWIEINGQYGQFLTEKDKILGYEQWTLKGELQFTLDGSLLFLGYEKSSVDDPFYLLNMHLPEVWYVCLERSF